MEMLTLAEAARLIAARKISPVELLDACLARIDAADAQLNSFVTLTRERAIAEARAAEAEIMRSGPRGPMHGIPYNLKDIFETKDIRTTAQSRLLAEHVPAEDCDAQTRLAAAGGVLLGKTATWEFAHGGPSWDVLSRRRAIPGTSRRIRPAPPPAPAPRSRRGWRWRPWDPTPAARSAVRQPPAASRA